MLDAASLFINEEGAINLSIGVLAGSSDTDFLVHSALVSFATMPAADSALQAFASFTLSDRDGSGALVHAGDTPGLGLFRGHYNGMAPGGTRFTHLVGFVSVGPGGTATSSSSDPQFGFRNVPDDVSSMSAEMNFSLTANDSLNASTSFGAVPEPATLVLMAAGLLPLLRRRG